jgi:hypothetical protein
MARQCRSWSGRYRPRARAPAAGRTGALFKAEIQGHRMVADASTKRALRSYSASRHYNDYYVAGSNGNVDGRRGVRLGEPGVQLLEVFKTPAPSQTPTAPAQPMPAPAAAKTGQKGSAAAQVQTGQSATQTEIPAAYLEDSGLYLQPRHQRVANVRFRTFRRNL